MSSEITPNIYNPNAVTIESHKARQNNSKITNPIESKLH